MDATGLRRRTLLTGAASLLAAQPWPQARRHAVQGYDAAQLLGIGLDATKGDVEADKVLFAAAMAAAKIDSPRGPFTLSAGHSPVQNIYLREAHGGENRVIGIAAPNLADPGTGCTLA